MTARARILLIIGVVVAAVSALVVTPAANAAGPTVVTFTFFTMYRQDTSGAWSYWTQSPTFSPTATYDRASWTTPPVPADTQAVTFGLTLDTVGTLTTDNYSLIDSSSP
jgi:hypothetical protein